MVWEILLGVTTLPIMGLVNHYKVNIRVVTVTNLALPPIQPHAGEAQSTINLALIGQYHYVALTVKDEAVAADAAEDHVIEQELAGFDANVQTWGLPLDTCLQKDDLIYSVAPSEDQTPVSLLEDPYFEEYAWPSSYPDGVGGFTYVKLSNSGITPRKFFNQRILNIDGRFANNLEYLLAAQYATEYKDIRDQVQIAMRQARGGAGHVITAGSVCNSSTVETMILKDTAYKFLHHIRGTPSYWQRVFHDVLAMQRQIGIPTWFLTLSAADMQWPDVIISIAAQHGRSFTEEDVAKMDWNEKTTWLRTNPVTAARHFQHRLDAFFSIVIRGDAAPLGIISDFVIRIEFQARGSPHAHCILWSTDTPRVDQHPDDEVIAFMDKYQHGSLPMDDSELQELVSQAPNTCTMHHACVKVFADIAYLSLCHHKQLLPGPQDKPTLHEAQQVMKKVHEVIQNLPPDSCIATENILEAAGVSQETYLEALRCNKTGMGVVLRRAHIDTHINNYNKDLLRIWKANMDLQFIVNPWACIVYVTSYMLKAERTMGELLRQTSLKNKNQALGALLCHGEANPITFVFVTYSLYYMYGCCVMLCTGKWFPFVHQFENCNPRSQRIIEGKERGKMWGHNWKRQFHAMVIYTYVSHRRKILSQVIMNENYHENG